MMKKLIKIASISIALIILVLSMSSIDAAKKKKFKRVDKGITDVSTLKIPNGVKFVDLSDNEFADINNLVIPKSVTRLVIEGGVLQTLDNISLGEGMKVAGFSVNQISSIKSLSLPSSLKELRLSTNQLDNDDLSDLVLPTNLKILSIGANQGITDLSNLTLPEGLEELNLARLNIPTIKAFNLPTSIKKIVVGGETVPLQDLDVFETKLPNLEDLRIINVPMVDFSTLKVSNKLRTLIIRSNEISDPSTLNLNEGLNLLNIANNEISNLQGLALPSTLKKLDISDNPLDDGDIDDLINILPKKIKKVTAYKTAFGKVSLFSKDGRKRLKRAFPKTKFVFFRTDLPG